MASSKAQVKIGDRLRGKVRLVTINKIFLDFPEGYRGLIRQREMSWDESRPNPQKIVKVGDEIEAIVLSVDDEKGNIELSLRFAVRDPWTVLLQEHKSGDIVEGVVEGVREHGAFVEIVDGVIGYLPTSEIRLHERVDRAQEVLWIGDKVRAVIQDIEIDKRRLRISVKEYLAAQPFLSPQKNELQTLREFLDAATLQKMKRIMGDITEETLWPDPDRIQRVLVVDDHDEFRNSMTQLLKDWGYIVFEAECLSAARESVVHNPVDVIFLDLSLSDGSAIEFAVDVKRDSPFTNILLLSGIDTNDALMDEADKKHLLLEYKPFGAEPLAEYLIGLEKNETVLPESSIVMSKKSTRTIRQQSFLGYIDADVQTIIREIVSKTKADGGALFHESASKKGEIDWLVLEGININDPEAHTLLYYSPVEDVIRDQEDLLIDNVYENQAQSKYLMRIVPFVSCVGLKITVPFESRGAALFLFSQDAQAFSRQVLDDSDRLALENLLYRQMIFRTLLSTQDEILRSQLRAGALHDVNNSLGSMDFKLSRLAERLRELEDGFSRETLAQAGLIANEIQSDAAQMRRTLELFRKLGRSNISEEADVNSIVRRAVEHHKALASHLNVDLTLTADSGIPGSNLNSSFVQQSIENIILNAIQWSAGHRTHRVEVHTSFDVNDTLLPIKVRVSDTGPGIHQQLHKEKIFELGYSTREKGSGLGLFIAKALIGAMGGKINVEQSIMEIGTTMCVSLPNSTTEA